MWRVNVLYIEPFHLVFHVQVTQWYRAPEVIMRDMDVRLEWSQAIDMWAFGCIFVELFDQVCYCTLKGEMRYRTVHQTSC